VRKRELVALIEQEIAPAFPQLTSNEDLLLAPEVDAPILCGYDFDRSDMDKTAFRVTAFAQPLYVPDNDLNLGVGVIVGDFTTATNPADIVAAMRATGGPWLARHADAASFARHVLDTPTWQIDKVLLREMRAYTLFYTGDARAARRALRMLLVRFRLDPDRSPAYAYRVRQLLAAGDEALALLDEWAATTRRKLGDPRSGALSQAPLHFRAVDQ
jgi:hypothetical protein